MADGKTNPDKVESPDDAPRNDGVRSAPKARWALPLLLITGLAAGAAGSEMIWATRGLFKVAPERLGMPPLPPDVQRDVLLANLANHAVGFGLFGLLLCGAVGLEVGAICRSAGLAVGALVVGAVLGFLFGAGGGAAAALVDKAVLDAPIDDLFKPMLIQLPNWLLLGVATAVTAALGAKGRSGKGGLLVSTLAAGLLAAVLYPLLGLVLVPAGSMDLSIPFDLRLRILCFAFGGALLGLGVGRWLNARH
jgi:hypothetical protein